MKVLKTEFRKHSFDYKQIERNDKAAIYSQTEPSNGRIVAYEVFEVRSHDGYKLGDNFIDPSETYPGNEAFGVWAWSISSYKKAVNRFKAITSGEHRIVSDEEIIENNAL